MEPKSEYQKMLHDNYHIAQKLGPAPRCPYCPQKKVLCVRRLLGLLLGRKRP
jgi:hypothetical protein